MSAAFLKVLAAFLEGPATYFGGFGGYPQHIWGVPAAHPEDARRVSGGGGYSQHLRWVSAVCFSSVSMFPEVFSALSLQRV